MELQEILKNHYEKALFYHVEITATEAEVKELQDELETLKTSRPTLKDVLDLMAVEMRKDPRMENFSVYNILGPFGMGNQWSIHFFRDGVSLKDRYQVPDSVRGITFEPSWKSGAMWNAKLRLVDYTVNTEQYRPGTLAEANGGNHPKIDLPETIKELVDVMIQELEQ